VRLPLQSSHVSQLVKIPGIITAATKPRVRLWPVLPHGDVQQDIISCPMLSMLTNMPLMRLRCCTQLKATFLTIQCKECKNTKRIICKPGMGGAMIPRYCDMGGAPGAPGNNCGVDCFNILPNRSGYVDQQQLKLQASWDCVEAPASGRVEASGGLPCMAQASVAACAVSHSSVLQQMLPMLRSMPHAALLSLDCRPSLAGASLSKCCSQADIQNIIPCRCRAQERPEDVPTGELPRNMSVLVDRLLVGKISPGTRVTVVGIYSVCGSKDSGGPKRKETNGAVAIRQPYLRVVGIEGDLDEDARQTRAFTCAPQHEMSTLM